MKTSYTKGVEAESLAARYLEDNGYEILQRRYKTKYGEIDLIACKGDVLCFVEVKTRSTLEEALSAITPRNRYRIEQSALHYTVLHDDAKSYDLRFDVVAITKDFEITHLDNAWFAGDN